MGLAGVARVRCILPLTLVSLGFRWDGPWSRTQDAPGVWMTSRPTPHGPGPDAAPLSPDPGTPPVAGLSFPKPPSERRRHRDPGEGARRRRETFSPSGSAR